MTGYQVVAADLTDPARGGQRATARTSPITVGGLTDGDRYTFTVTASSAAGPGRPTTSGAVLIGPHDRPARVSVVTGSAQKAPATRSFAVPLTVRVTDRTGAAVPGVTVTFAVAAGAARFAPGRTDTVVVTADSDGRAVAPTLMAGAVPGRILVTARSGGAVTTFVETAVPVQADLAVSVQVPQRVRKGQEFLVRVTVINRGPLTVDHPVLRLFLPSVVYGTAAGGGYGDGSGLVRGLTALPPGGRFTWTVQLRPVDPAFTGRAHLGVAAGSGTPDPNPADNTASAFVAVT